MLSRALLIARALLHMQVGTSAFRDHFDAALCDRQGGAVPPGRGRFCPREHPPRARPWRRGSPDPIPNSEVKPAIAESTAEPVRGRIGRRARGGCFLSAGPRTSRWSGGLLRVGGSRGRACTRPCSRFQPCFPLSCRAGRSADQSASNGVVHGEKLIVRILSHVLNT